MDQCNSAIKFEVKYIQQAYKRLVYDLPEIRVSSIDGVMKEQF